MIRAASGYADQFLLWFLGKLLAKQFRNVSRKENKKRLLQKQELPTTTYLTIAKAIYTDQQVSVKLLFRLSRRIVPHNSLTSLYSLATGSIVILLGK